MPLLGKYTVAGVDVWVWKVTETLDELLPMVPDECAAYALDNFSSRKRRTEWLAVRAAVAQSFGDGVRIVYDAAGKPLLDGVDGCISISHTDGYAVVAYSRDGDVGVDVELPARDVASVARRFMPSELLDGLSLGERNSVALLHWCAKEALFKIVGDLGGNFKDNICVAPFVPGDEGRLSLSLVGIDCDGARGFVADYYIRDGLLVVLCRRCCVAG